MYLFRKIVANENGLALLITVTIISLLIVVTLQINNNSRNDMIASANYKDMVELRGIVLSGINIAEVVLEYDLFQNEYDSQFDSWALLAKEKFPSFFERGTLGLEIEDLSARFQINSLVDQAPDPQKQDELRGNQAKQIFKNLLLLGPFSIEEESRAIEIVDAVVDWIDSDDHESDYGAEDSYYQSLGTPYNCKNAPIEFMEELLLIKGISRELLYGSKGSKGLSHYITVHGSDGKVNINSADPLLLEALNTGISEELAEGMVEFRNLEENKDNLKVADWYLMVPDWPGDLVIDDKMLTVMSRYFKIKATATLNSLTRKLDALVYRDENQKKTITLLARKVE